MAILGIDEVGRGPLAGPLVVGAVVLPEFEIGGGEQVSEASGDGQKSGTDGGKAMLSGPEWILELRDSKKLSAKKREKLAEIIQREAPASGLGWVSPVELDELGMGEALRLATRRAVKSVQRLHTGFSQIVIDGKVNFLSLTPLEKYVTTVVKADDLVKEVSAASIIAKVARDRYMCEIAEKYPEYGFEKHMGYGTTFHREAIMKYGVTPEHRKSFEPVRSLVWFERDEGVGGKENGEKEIATGKRGNKVSGVVKNTTKIGQQGETAVCEFLVREGHEIVFRNFKTYYCEIDIVSVKGNMIYFTEVKTRKNDWAGGGMAAIDKKKLEKMRFAVECFLKYYSDRFQDLNPMLAAASVNGEFAVEDWVVIR